MSHDIELLASYWTMASGATPHSTHEHSSAPFAERVTAAARAGFTGFGIWHADLEHTLRTLTLRDMKLILEDNGIRHVELEFLSHWWLPPGEQRTASDAVRRLVLDPAAVLGARAGKGGD